MEGTRAVSTPTMCTLGTLFFNRAGDAADQSAAAHGHDHRFQIRNLFQQFQADGSLSRDHRVVIERVQKYQPFGVAAAARFVHRFIEIIAVQNHFRAIAARGGDLHQRRQHRHADLHANAALRRVIRHRLRVIARPTP